MPSSPLPHPILPLSFCSPLLPHILVCIEPYIFGIICQTMHNLFDTMHQIMQHYTKFKFLLDTSNQASENYKNFNQSGYLILYTRSHWTSRGYWILVWRRFTLTNPIGCHGIVPAGLYTINMQYLISLMILPDFIKWS